MQEGTSLRQSAKNHGITQDKFFRFIDQNPLLADCYSRAQVAKAELYADEIIEISDTDPDPQRARNRIDARKWYASKMQPQKYGDRLDVHVKDTVDIKSALSEARARAQLRSVRDQQDIEDAQIVDIKQLNDNSTTDSKSSDAPKTGNATDFSDDELFK